VYLYIFRRFHGPENGKKKKESRGICLWKRECGNSGAVTSLSERTPGKACALSWPDADKTGTVMNREEKSEKKSAF